MCNKFENFFQIGNEDVINHWLYKKEYEYRHLELALETFLYVPTYVQHWKLDLHIWDQLPISGFQTTKSCCVLKNICWKVYTFGIIASSTTEYSLKGYTVVNSARIDENLYLWS